MKLFFPFTNPDVYCNDDKYLAMLAMSTKIHLNDKLLHDGVVFVKDVLEAFSFDISGWDISVLALAWISPVRFGTNGIHDKRYKVKFYVEEANHPESSRWKYRLVLIINDKPRKGKKI